MFTWRQECGDGDAALATLGPRAPPRVTHQHGLAEIWNGHGDSQVHGASLPAADFSFRINHFLLEQFWILTQTWSLAAKT